MKEAVFIPLEPPPLGEADPSVAACLAVLAQGSLSRRRMVETVRGAILSRDREIQMLKHVIYSLKGTYP